MSKCPASSTVNTGLAALLGDKNLRWGVAAAGIVFALSWWWLLQSYRKPNSAKFEVINAIEPLGCRFNCFPMSGIA